MRYGLKERLLGALVLIALAVIFVPFLLEEKRPEASISDKIITPEPPAPVKSIVKKPVAPKLPPSLNEQQKQQLVSKNNATNSGLTLNPEGGANAWAIQVATFGESVNAKRLVTELKQKKYHAYWRKINGMAVVFVGPYLSQKQGREHQDKLLQEQALKTLLTGYVPEYEARIQGSLPADND